MESKPYASGSLHDGNAAVLVELGRACMVAVVDEQALNLVQ